MKLTIEIITAIMKYEAEQYKKGYDEAVKARTEAEKILNDNFKPGTEYYKKQKASIEADFEKTIGELKVTATEKGLTVVQELREQERERIGNINETLLAKLQALKDVPLTELELLAIADKIGAKNDYYASRMLLNLAEKNGVQLFDRAIEASYDVKMNVLDQLTNQFDEILKEYPGDKWNNSAIKHVYLSDTVIERAKAIYNGNTATASDEQIADKAYWTVKGQATQVEKGLAISNVLRNAKGESKNLLLCKLAEDNTIQEMALQLSGYSDEINSFKRGKAAEYRNALQVMANIANTTDKEVIQRLKFENANNSFLDGLIESEAKRNELFAELVMPTGNEVVVQ